MVTFSHGDLTAPTIRSRPSGVRPRPQWFSRPSVTPAFSAASAHSPRASMHHLYPSSSVYPSTGGSTPLFAMSLLKLPLVPQVPVFTRMVGMPNLAAISIWFFVSSTFFFRLSASGVRNVWWVDRPMRQRPLTNACRFSRVMRAWSGASPIWRRRISTPSNPVSAARSMQTPTSR